VRDHIVAQVIADRLGVPVHTGEEVLDGIGRAIARGLGELPPVLSRDGGEQATQIGEDTPARLRAGEVPGPAVGQLAQPVGPADNLGQRRHLGTSSVP